MIDLEKDNEHGPWEFDNVIWSIQDVKSLLVAACDLNELKRIIFQLFSNEKDFAGSTKEDVAQALVDYCARHGYITALLQVAQKHNDFKFKKIKNELHAVPRVSRIGVIVVAMTRTQAETLSEALPDFVQFRTHFQHFQQFFHTPCDYTEKEWLDCYGDKPDDWKPYACYPKTVKEIIDETFRVFTEQGNNLLTFEPEFYTEHFFKMPPKDAIAQLKREDFDGYLIVVDAISLIHDGVRYQLDQSRLDGDPSLPVMMFVLSPVNLTTIPLHTAAQKLFERHFNLAFGKYSDHWEPLFNFGGADQVWFQRQIAKALSNVKERTLRPRIHGQNGEKLEKQFGKENGIYQHMWKTSSRS